MPNCNIVERLRAREKQLAVSQLNYTNKKLLREAADYIERLHVRINMHESTFKYLKPSADQQADMAEVRRAYMRLSQVVETITPPGRYRALAMTALEESAMWANKAITRQNDGTPRDGAEIGSD